MLVILVVFWSWVAWSISGEEEMRRGKEPIKSPTFEINLLFHQELTHSCSSNPTFQYSLPLQLKNLRAPDFKNTLFLCQIVHRGQLPSKCQDHHIMLYWISSNSLSCVYSIAAHEEVDYNKAGSFPMAHVIIGRGYLLGYLSFFPDIYSSVSRQMVQLCCHHLFQRYWTMKKHYWNFKLYTWSMWSTKLTHLSLSIQKTHTSTYLWTCLWWSSDHPNWYLYFLALFASFVLLKMFTSLQDTDGANLQPPPPPSLKYRTRVSPQNLKSQCIFGSEV